MNSSLEFHPANSLDVKNYEKRKTKQTRRGTFCLKRNTAMDVCFSEKERKQDGEETRQAYSNKRKTNFNLHTSCFYWAP